MVAVRVILLRALFTSHHPTGKSEITPKFLHYSEQTESDFVYREIDAHRKSTMSWCFEWRFKIVRLCKDVLEMVRCKCYGDIRHLNSRRLLTLRLHKAFKSLLTPSSVPSNGIS